MYSDLDRRTHATVYITLAILIAAAYSQAPFHDFVEYDDPLYVTDSSITQAGITWEGVRWAFTDTSSGNWHPLTRLAHMLDCELFGLNPAGHHAMSIFWHIVATLLLLSVLASMTRAFWPSVFVAALFGLHPLHVESVAWISERKDVMSAVCWFAAIGLYARYTRNPSILRYVAIMAVFAIGLMVKAMLVTLPCVFLLLDFWPLRRIEAATGSTMRRSIALVLEKTPFFLMAAGHGVLTYQAQNIAMSSMDAIPLNQRIANATVAYSTYVWQTVWPTKLAVFYPHPIQQDITASAVAAGLCLTAITVATLFLWRRRPYLAVGWLWFVGTLVPVIGVVQVGLQSHADRYTYIPSVGLFIAAVWLGVSIVKSRPNLRVPFTAAAVGIVLVCAVLTAMQVRHWKNTESLFQHALAVTENNLIANINVGHVYMERGEHTLAQPHFEKAVALGDQTGWHIVAARAHFGLGRIAEAKDELDVAEYHYNIAQTSDKTFSEAINNLASIHMEMGRRRFADGDRESGRNLFEVALTELERSLIADPENHEARFNAAFLLHYFAGERQDAELYMRAEEMYRSVLPHFDEWPEVHHNYGLVLEQLGRYEDAIRHADRAIELDPDYEAAKAALARYQRKAGRPKTQ